MIRFLDLHKQYLGIKEEMDAAIASVIEQSAFIGGPGVKRFEQAFAAFQQAEHCVGVGNGTDALEIAIEALDLPADAEVLVPANSFIASAEAVTRSGARVVFCDTDPHDFTIDVARLAQRITPKTAAIIAVHLYGHPCDMDGLLSVAQTHDLKIIEDCAQAHGAEYKGRRVGAIGDVGCFSFYPGKNLGAYGDGGAVVTNDQTLAEQVRMIANHGRLAKYDHQFEGRNSRLDGLQAAVLSVKLKHLESWTVRRIELADEYLAGLAGVKGLELPRRSPDVRQAYHLFVVRTSKRDALKAYLADREIQAGIHYPKALPKLQAYAYLNQRDETGAGWHQDETLLSLPIGDHLESVAPVIEAVQDFFREVS